MPNEPPGQPSFGRRNPEDIFLYYHPYTRKTGQRLGQYLGVPHDENWPNNQRFEYVIRWGCRRGSGAYGEVLNPRTNIANASDKFNALQTFERDYVPVPDFTTNRDDIGPTDEAEIQYPVLGRSQSHSQGSDVLLVLQDRDIRVQGTRHHYIDYIPKQSEFRVHVFDGDIVAVHEKMQQSETDGDEHESHIWNHESGWVFLNPRHDWPDTDIAVDAVESLGLDFGAVDMIRDEATGDEFVLEVNTAPTLDENNLIRWGNRMTEYTGLNEIAGPDVVDWSEDDNDDNDDSE